MSVRPNVTKKARPELTIVGYALVAAFALVNAGMFRITAFTCSTVIRRVHSNWRGVSLWRGRFAR